MFNSEKINQDAVIATKTIELINLGKVQILLPNNYWDSTLTNIKELTNGPYYGNMGNKIVIKYNMIFLAYTILTILFSPWPWYINAFCIFIALYVINKFRTRSLKNCIQTIALNNPYDFINAWNKKLFALKSEINNKIYISDSNDLKELIKEIDEIQQKI